MTLNDKFNPYCDNLFSSKEVNSESCVEIADDYAIEFGDFIERIKDADIDSIDYDTYLNYTMEQLLQIFKKEKGL